MRALCGDDAEDEPLRDQMCEKCSKPCADSIPTLGAESGGDSTPCSYLSETRHRLILGGQCINWPCPDLVLAMKFWDEDRLWSLPEALRDQQIRVQGFDQILVATLPLTKWGKMQVKDWVFRLVCNVRHHAPQAVIKILTCLPRQDKLKMMYINFNRNLSAAIHAAKAKYGRVVFYVPWHKYVLDELNVPVDGIYDRADLKLLRQELIRRLGLGEW